MPANFTQEEKDTIRMALLNTGFALCRESGVKGMTVAELTQRCGIAKGTFYHFFEDAIKTNIDLIFKTIYEYMKET